jgi:hypothetical protein
MIVVETLNEWLLTRPGELGAAVDLQSIPQECWRFVAGSKFNRRI